MNFKDVEIIRGTSHLMAPIRTSNFWARWRKDIYVPAGKCGYGFRIDEANLGKRPGLRENCGRKFFVSMRFKNTRRRDFNDELKRQMHVFRVWAPLPRKVEVQVGTERHPMQAEPGGWWSAVVEVMTGDDYGFVLDSHGPLPDPRSPYQPHGVHGLSRLVDHAAFRWSDQGFRAVPLSRAVIYELHVGTFTADGTFKAAMEKLDYLVELGVTHVELMPVAEFSGERGWGYDGVDLFAPHHVYGGPDGLKELVNGCHARGLAVLLDVVYNHIGPSGNYLGKYGHYLTRRYSTPWGEAVNFDGPHSDEVRRFCCDNALMWLRDYHFDGLRLDAVDHILDTSAVPILEQLSAEVGDLASQLDRPLVLIAESDVNDPKLLRARENGGYGLDAKWNDDFHHALHSVLTGEQNGYYVDFGKMADLAKALAQGYVFDGQYCEFRQRRRGRAPAGIGGHHLLAYTQNHDQVGNRPMGDRLSHQVSPGRLKIAAALMLTSPFVPMLFQGEEWATATRFQYFTDHAEEHLGKAVREGRVAGFEELGFKLQGTTPDPQAQTTFLESKLDWTELSQSSHAEMLEWHRQLFAVRRDELTTLDTRLESVKTRYDEAARWLVVERGPITVACNLGDGPRRISLRAGNHEMLLQSEHGIKTEAGAVTLPADSVIVLKHQAA